MKTINIQLSEVDAQALSDVIEYLDEFNWSQGEYFLPRLEYTLRKAVKGGHLGIDDAFETFGLISKLTSQTALRNESVWRAKEAVDEGIKAAEEA